MLRAWTVAGTLVLGIGVGTSAWAQHDHEGDVAVSASNGVLQIGGGHFEIHGMTGYKIFEADFRDLAGGPWLTRNPGFQTQEGNTLAPLSLITFEGLGALSFWDGSAWGAAAGGVTVGVADVLAGAVTGWSSTGVTPGEYTYVGQVSSTGVLHEHLAMSINSDAPVGAYLIQMSLGSDSYAASAPFYIAFNNGLSADAFESSIGALVAAPVPEPETYAMLAAGLAVIGAVARRRRQREAA